MRLYLSTHGFEHVQISSPPISLCTDNAAMIAWAGWEIELNVQPLRKWWLQDLPESEKGVRVDGKFWQESGWGILNISGWKKRVASIEDLTR